jgi:protein-tyrosine phosphatase
MLKIFFLFLSIGIVLILYGITLPWIGGLIIWLGISFVITGISYSTNSAWVFGKSCQGNRDWRSLLFLWPYLGFTWLTWWIFRKVDSHPCYNQITDQIWLGRRPTVTELPNRVDLVVDITCEFTPQKAIRTSYLSLPVLDHAVPKMEEFNQLIHQLNNFPGRLYIHCAAGRSRSAMTVAAILLKKGICQTPQESIDHIHARRPCVELTDEQKHFLDKWFDLEGN